MSEMVERVAAAITAAMFTEEELPFRRMEGDLMANYRATARAAIASMREPSAAMLSAQVQNTYEVVGDPMDEPGALDQSCALWVWHAMIDEALK